MRLRYFMILPSQKILPAKIFREKAADLALDSLVLAKNDELIEKWTGEFAVAFPHQKARFQKNFVESCF